MRVIVRARSKDTVRTQVTGKVRSSRGVLPDRSRAEEHDRGRESGAVLILALVYIIVIGLVVTALLSWTTNDLDNTKHFNAASETRYAVSSTMTTAIESVRYSPLESPVPTKNVPTGWEECWAPTSGTVSSLTIDGYTVDVYCNTVEDVTQAATRTVTFDACLNTFSAASCEANPLLTAVAVFDDYPEGGGIILSEQCNLEGAPCGEGESLTSWIWA
jgi:hypothetical protein